MRRDLPVILLLLVACGCHLTESSREKLVRSMLEHPGRIDSIARNNPLSHDYATTYPPGPSGTKLLENYFRKVSADYTIEEVEISEAPEKTLVRVLSRKHGIERAQFQFGRDARGWHMETMVIGHPQFVNDW